MTMLNGTPQLSMMGEFLHAPGTAAAAGKVSIDGSEQKSNLE